MEVVYKIHIIQQVQFSLWIFYCFSSKPVRDTSRASINLQIAQIEIVN